MGAVGNAVGLVFIIAAVHLELGNTAQGYAVHSDITAVQIKLAAIVQGDKTHMTGLDGDIGALKLNRIAFCHMSASAVDVDCHGGVVSGRARRSILNAASHSGGATDGDGGVGFLGIDGADLNRAHLAVAVDVDGTAVGDNLNVAAHIAVGQLHSAGGALDGDRTDGAVGGLDVAGPVNRGGLTVDGHGPLAVHRDRANRRVGQLDRPGVVDEGTATLVSDAIGSAHVLQSQAGQTGGDAGQGARGKDTAVGVPLHGQVSQLGAGDAAKGSTVEQREGSAGHIGGKAGARGANHGEVVFVHIHRERSR